MDLRATANHANALLEGRLESDGPKLCAG
jgi:hypothetical protein